MVISMICHLWQVWHGISWKKLSNTVSRAVVLNQFVNLFNFSIDEDQKLFGFWACLYDCMTMHYNVAPRCSITMNLSTEMKCSNHNEMQHCVNALWCINTVLHLDWCSPVTVIPSIHRNKSIAVIDQLCSWRVFCAKVSCTIWAHWRWCLCMKLIKTMIIFISWAFVDH